MCKTLCLPCKACAECVRKTIVPIIFLAWLNFLVNSIAAFSPYWVTTNNGSRDAADGPLIECLTPEEDGNLLDYQCSFKDIPSQTSDLLMAGSYCMMFAEIGFFITIVLASLMKCKCLEATRVCFVGVIIVATIISGLLCLATLVLYGVEYGTDILDSPEDIQFFSWAYYIAFVECVIAIPTVIIDFMFCACCATCWTAQGAMCCCC